MEMGRNYKIILLKAKKKHRYPFKRTSTGAPDLQFPTDIEITVELFKFLIVP
jgi:hypothetical protein